MHVKPLISWSLVISLAVACKTTLAVGKFIFTVIRKFKSHPFICMKLTAVKVAARLLPSWSAWAKHRAATWQLLCFEMVPSRDRRSCRALSILPRSGALIAACLSAAEFVCADYGGRRDDNFHLLIVKVFLYFCMTFI